MKIQNFFLVCLTMLVFTTLAQQPSPPRQPMPPSASEPTLTQFNLDFPGGTPKELVAAIQKATGKPLNAIIPEENADVKLPPLKMDNVNVARLFQALERASEKTVATVTGTTYGGFSPQQTYQYTVIGYGFKTDSATISDETIWYFYVKKPVPPPAEPPPTKSKICRFYSLTPYLERGLTVDDITTAIQTGWKMQGDKETPSISFHKETKLLIAVGEPDKLETIDAVLKALEPPKPEPARPLRTIPIPPGKPAETSKTDE